MRGVWRVWVSGATRTCATFMGTIWPSRSAASVSGVRWTTVRSRARPRRCASVATAVDLCPDGPTRSTGSRATYAAAM